MRPNFMAPHTEYKLISANSPADFQKELTNRTTSGWKPILLTSAANGNQVSIATILEQPPRTDAGVHSIEAT
jgi:hypothetical protein